MRFAHRPSTATLNVLRDAQGVTSAEYAIMATVIIVAVGAFTTAVDNPLRAALGLVGTTATTVINTVIGTAGGGSR